MMGVTWFTLGFISILSGYFLLEYKKKYKWNTLVTIGFISGIGTILFSIAWAVGAVLEGVPRSAGMGLLVFGLGGIVILSVTFRLGWYRILLCPCVSGCKIFEDHASGQTNKISAPMVGGLVSFLQLFFENDMIIIPFYS